ncbi:DUF2515 family protein [Pseudomonas saxonica]|uniref:DUF2515 family protein n=1 Tax=Pseudomonas saxonica TaxID=2600598 RepID=UPI001FCC4930|nr:PAAR domain-containing protein [Pseudomonas saxonica]
MTQCFKDHPSDNEKLNENIKPLDECKTHKMEVLGVEMMITDVPILTCDCLWRIYQQEAEEIVAPGGVLIADPIERNRAINAAYARLWLHDSRFQWAGLAAFASKQVGCGLLHATESMEKLEVELKAVAKFMKITPFLSRIYRQNDLIELIYNLTKLNVEDFAEFRIEDLNDLTDEKIKSIIDDLKTLGGRFNTLTFEEVKEQVVDKFKELTVDRVDAVVSAFEEFQAANADNPIPVDVRVGAMKLGAVQRQLKYVHDMLALGNTTLFLDIYPLHQFYAKRGLAELKGCLDERAKIYDHSRFPVLWPVGQEIVKFGLAHEKILEAFKAVDDGRVSESVEQFAAHEQRNILQPAIYKDAHFVILLRGNQFFYVTDILPGAAPAIELTLTSQCQSVQDDHTIGFSSESNADLSDIEQRMAFVLRAADKFDKILKGDGRKFLESSINEIAIAKK